MHYDCRPHLCIYCMHHCGFNGECIPPERTGPSQNRIRSTQQQQAAASVINSGANVYERIVSQQPIQFQNIAGPGQVSFNGNPPPLYYGGNPYPNQGYFQDPTKMAYATLPMHAAISNIFYATPALRWKLYYNTSTGMQSYTHVHVVVKNVCYISYIYVTGFQN